MMQVLLFWLFFDRAYTTTYTATEEWTCQDVFPVAERTMASLVKRTFQSGQIWYIQFYVGEKQRRIRASENYQIAKEKLRQFESARARGDDLPLPTRTLTAEVLERYVRHIRTYKTPKSAQTNIYYLQAAFGPICEALTQTHRKPSCAPAAKERKFTGDGRRKAPRIESVYFEHITTADIATFVDLRVQLRKLSPRTANHFRAILMRLFSWAMMQHGIKMPGGAEKVTSTFFVVGS